MALLSSCAVLWRHPDLRASPALWGALDVSYPNAPAQEKAALAAWLRRRRGAIRQLHLRMVSDRRDSPAEVLEGLAGGPLAQLWLSGGQELGELELELASGTAFHQLEALPHLTALRLVRPPSPERKACTRARPCAARQPSEPLPCPPARPPAICWLLMQQEAASKSAPMRRIGCHARPPHYARAVLQEGCGLHDLPALCALPSLRSLAVGPNPGLGTSSPKLGALRHLTGLTELCLTHVDLWTFPPLIAALPRLSALSLEGNPRLGAVGGGALFTPLQALGGRLRRLSLAGCGLRGLPPQLSALSRLEELALGGNRHLGEGGDYSFLPLRHLLRLTRLDLSRWVGALTCIIRCSWVGGQLDCYL